MASNSPLLSLPAELRNLIYEYVAASEDRFRLKKRLRQQSGQHLISKSGLSLVCRQTHIEYYGVLVKVALEARTPIDCTVIDLDFRAVESFVMNTIGVANIAKFNESRNLRARLVITALHNVEHKHVVRWIDFCGRTSTELSYRVIDEECGQLPSYGEASMFNIGRHGDAPNFAAALEEWETRARKACGHRVPYRGSKHADFPF